MKGMGILPIKFDVVTVFPEIFSAFCKTALLGRAVERGMVSIHLHDLREWAPLPKSPGGRARVDDAPYGGGDGMVMAPEPLAKALDALSHLKAGRKIIYLTPEGEVFSHRIAQRLAGEGGAILLCGRYGGIDERIREMYVEEEISLGDYVLMGGELPAMVVMETAARFVPGVLGNEDSLQADSFGSGLLEGPQYTRPRDFRGHEVPQVLLSGDHEAIRRFRQEKSLHRTLERRPDLLDTKDRKSERVP
jgi:tRNA (guanine37-N1)-methyltransferase